MVFSWCFIHQRSADFHAGARPCGTRCCLSFGIVSPVCLVPTRLFQGSGRTNASPVLVGKGRSRAGTLPWRVAGRRGLLFAGTRAGLGSGSVIYCRVTQVQRGCFSFLQAIVVPLKKKKKKARSLCVELIFLQYSLFLADSKH